MYLYMCTVNTFNQHSVYLNQYNADTGRPLPLPLLKV